MPAIKSKDLQIFNAKQFRQSIIGSSAANVYFTFGRSYPWEDDTDPPIANTSMSSFYEIWNNMIGGKKIVGNNVRHVIRRHNWASGLVYNAYSDTTDPEAAEAANSAPYYVVTDDWNVYKCLSNNYGALSTSKPKSISALSDLQTEDGYIWKYMYTVTAEEQLRFVTNEYIPVRTLSTNDQSLQWQVQTNAINGAIHDIIVLNGGSYYSNNIVVSITGDGQDANAFAVRDISSNSISSIVIDNKGINYTYAVVTISSSMGYGGEARAVISPPGGHGSDALSELGGSNIMVNMTLKNNDSKKLPVTNQYRQIALVENPLVYKSETISSNVSTSQTMQLELSGVSIEYEQDEIVYQGPSLDKFTFKGTVVEWDSANNLIKLSNTTGKPRAELLIGNTTTAARFLSSITYPDWQPYSGKILYIDNIIPIERAADQAEDFKVVLNF